MRFSSRIWPMFAAVLALGDPATTLGASNYEPYRFTTFVPSGSGDRPGFNARFNFPQATATDAAGNVYIADAGNNMIRQIDAAGLVRTVAGNVVSGSTDGMGTAAQFFFPYGIAVDGDGNLFVADTYNSLIRKITTDGFVSTLAGGPGGTQGTGSQDGQGRAARFNFPEAITVDQQGNLYVVDTGNATLRKINPAGFVTTLAGMPGAVGYADGTGAAARFSNPSAIVVDPSGNLFVADAGNQTIRKVTSTGVVSTFAGTAGSYGYSDGVGAAARFNTPKGMAIDAAANLYVADNSIRKISPSAVVTTLAGGGYGSREGQGAAAAFASPHGLSVGPSGVVYVADQDNHTIRKISPTGFVVTMAGAPHVGGYDDDPGTPPRLAGCRGIAVDFSGALYVYNNETIHKITPDGMEKTLTGVKGRAGNGGEDGNGSGGDPGTAALLTNAEHLCVNQQGTIYTGHGGNVRQIVPDGTVRNLAGYWYHVGSVDGIGANARFAFPQGFAVDRTGNVYVADTGNCTVRKVTPEGVVSTLAGLAQNPGTSDGLGSAARFAYPKGLTVDRAGNVYVADSFYNVRGNTIRKITPAGQVTTLAGLAGTFGNSDGAGSEARFSDPTDVAVDDAGNLYVADRGNCSIRKVTPTGVVTTLAGSNGGNAGYADGDGSAVRFGNPEGIEVDQAGRLYVIEGSRLRIGRSLQTPQLMNVSTRLNVGTDDQVGIGGFIVAGTGLKKVILRAVGPSLAGFGLGDRALADPMLELWDSAGQMVARNDNWMTNDQTQQSQEDEVRATALAPSSNLEPAIIATVHPQQGYTAIVRGMAGGTGLGLVEAYDLNVEGVSQLANISTRGFVRTGDDVMIGGFITGRGDSNGKVMVRAIGPSLSVAGIRDALPDTVLELRDANGALVTSNDDWRDTNQDMIELTGLAPSDNRESAILAALPAGAYTAIVSGKGGTGVGLVEVYQLP